MNEEIDWTGIEEIIQDAFWQVQAEASRDEDE